MNEQAEASRGKGREIAEKHKSRAKGIVRSRRESQGDGERGRQGPPERAKAYGYRGTSPDKGRSEERREERGGRGNAYGREAREAGGESSIAERVRAMRERNRERSRGRGRD